MNFVQCIIVNRQHGPPRSAQKRQPWRQKLAEHAQYTDGRRQHDDDAMQDRDIVGVAGGKQKRSVEHRIERRPSEIEMETALPCKRVLEILGRVTRGDVTQLPNAPDNLALEKEDKDVAGPSALQDLR